MAVFAYWCAVCRGWFDAGLDADTADQVRRKQRKSRDLPGTWTHPGQATCPACGTPAKSYLPTEFTTTRARANFLPSIAKSEQTGAEQPQLDV
jgi:hypothetical protein